MPFGFSKKQLLIVAVLVVVAIKWARSASGQASTLPIIGK